MQNIEEQAINNYQENITYFKKNHEALFNKLSALELLIEEGSYPQKYDLEYKDGYFDVKDLKSGNYLYAMDSNVCSQELDEQITFKKKDQVCETFYNLDFTESALEKAINSSPIHTHANVAPIIDYYNTHVNSDMHLKRIYKFMFLGLGLALHLPKIMQRLDPEVILIIEDDIELFRLSLFTCNYAKALNNCIALFSIAENDTEFTNTLDTFYQKSTIYNQYLKFSIFSLNYQSKIKKIQEYIIARPEKCYTHERILSKNQKVLQKIKEKYKYLDLVKKDKETFFDDKPVLIVGAGPSLQNNLEWLEKNSKKFIVIAVFAALKTLSKKNISPDIVMQLDEKVNEGVNLVKSFDNFDFVKDSIFILSPSVPDIFFETFKRENIFLVEDRSYYKQAALQIKAYSVGEVAYSLSLIFNAKETYLLGLDLAVADDGSSHSKDHHWTKKLDTSKSDEAQTITSLQLTTLKTKGNFKDVVFTTPLFAISIQKLNNYTLSLKSPSQNVFNLSDGAFFENIKPLKVENLPDLKDINKTEMTTNLNKTFSKYSSSELSDQEIKHIKMRIEQIDSFYKHLKYFEEAPTSNEKQFINEYKRMIIALMQANESELRELIIVYLYNTSNYVVDFFNTQELTNPKKHTKKMKKLIVSQLEKILSFYEDTIKGINLVK